MNGIKITPVQKSDIKEIFRLQGEFDAYLQSLTSKKRTDYGAERQKAFVKFGFGRKPAFKCLVAKSGKVALGYVCYHMGYDPSEMLGPVVHIVDLFVTEKARGLGVGNSLMKKVSEICRKEHGIAIYFCVWKRNKAAIRFYKRIGAELDWSAPFMSWPKRKW